MKRWTAILALALLLTGCSPDRKDPTTQPTSSTVTTPTAPSEPQPERAPVQTENLDRAYQTLVSMEDHLLLIGDGIISLYTPSGVTATTAVSLPNENAGCLRVTEDRIVYYDADANALVTLDRSLKEIAREALSEPITGTPWISADGKLLYYCTPEGIRIFDTVNHITRNLKIHAGSWQGISGSLFDHTQLICRLAQEDGTLRLLLIHTETGATTYEGNALASITGSGNFYCCITDREWIFGNADDQPQNFLVNEAIPLPQNQTAYTLTAAQEGLLMDLYDLNTGLHSAQVLFPDVTSLNGPVVWQDQLVFLSGSQLYFWDPTLSPVEDETQYTAYRYTADDPDTDGLAAIQAQADALGKQYGIDILLWNDATAVQPEGYEFVVEHRTRIYEDALAALETTLAQLPKNFLQTAASWTEDGKIHLVLVRSITTPADECGSHYLLGWNAYIPLVLDENMTKTFYHGLGHVLDTHVLSHSSAFYEWHTVNPSGFQYDNDFDSWQDRKSQYLEGSSRYFVNSFAMTFPVEDRATMFEYAMTADNADVFSSKHMQAKLKRLQKGLRETFDLEGDSYPWEQYLK